MTTIVDHIVNSLRWALAMRKGNIMLPKIPLSKVEFEGKSSEPVEVAIKKKGWALVDSAMLGGQIIVTDIRKTPRGLPETLSELVPTYTTDELMKLGVLGAENGWSVGDLRRMHFVRNELGGEIIA